MEVPLLPNDLVLDASGGIYFTDWKQNTPQELGDSGVYYLPASGELQRAVGVPQATSANGIAISPDETAMYVARPFGGGVFRHDIISAGVLGKGQLFAPAPTGSDGITTDRHGNVYVPQLGANPETGLIPPGLPDATVSVFSPDGDLLLEFAPPGGAINLTFDDQDNLYMTGWNQLTRAKVNFVSELGANPINWRSEGRFNAEDSPATAVNTFGDASVQGISLTNVDFSHQIAAIDAGVLQLNDGVFEINADNGDSLFGVYTDFRYTPNPAPATNFAGAGEFDFIAVRAFFFGASGSGNWTAEAAFDEGSSTTGTADHNWTGEVVLPNGPSDSLQVPSYKFVAPSHLESIEGGGQTSNEEAARIQEIHSSENFALLKEAQQPFEIVELRLRPDGVVDVPAEVNYSSLEIRLGVTPTAPDELKATYAQNIADAINHTLVVDGAVRATTQTIRTPDSTMAFDVSIPLDTPFEYSPNDGNLLFEANLSAPDTPSNWDFADEGTLMLLGGGRLEEGWTLPIELVFRPILHGDFNGSGILDAEDIDMLSAVVGSSSPLFEVHQDGAIDVLDRVLWIQELAMTRAGDTDLDGDVDFPDFLSLSVSFGQEGGWAQGDFDGNRMVEFPDFLLLSANFTFERTDATQVPEPDQFRVLLLLFLVLRRVNLKKLGRRNGFGL